MTEALYLDDSTVRRFEATVERALDDRVVLDRTHFYPEGGGQPADRGTLSTGDRDWQVTDVQKKDTVYHYLSGDGDPPEPGTTVTGELDWERRRAHMRYHTAQHLLSALLLDEYDAPTAGNQLYADRARIDVEHDRFDETDLADVEARMNELVEADMSVDWYEMDRERAERELDTERTRIDLLPDSIDELRIVEIREARRASNGESSAGRSPADHSSGQSPREDGERCDPRDDPYDRTACAGTHVRNTEACGEVTVTGRETGGSDRERITFTLDP